MRVFLGIILGCALTVGTAYIHDRGTFSNEVAASPMVNWETVGQTLDQLASRARSEWNRLTG